MKPTPLISNNAALPSAPTFSQTFSYDGVNRLLSASEYNGANWSQAYNYALGQLAAEYYSSTKPTPPCTTCFLTYDYLGNVRMVTDAQANVIARHDFAPFGQEIPSGTGGRSSDWGSTTDVDMKFTGQIRDQELSEDFFNARYFAFALGRFNSPDPGNAGATLASSQSWNGYAYALNKPLRFVDPSGRYCIYVGGDEGDTTDRDNYEDDENGGPSCAELFASDPQSTSVNASPDPIQTVPAPGFFGPGQTIGGPAMPAETGIFTTIKQKFCAAIPDARTISVDVGAGGLGSVHGSVTATLDYKTGLTSFSASGGFLGGWNGVLSASISTGFVYGSSDTNTSTNYSLGSAVSGYYSKSGGAREVGVSAGWGLLGKYSLGVGQYKSTASVGNVPGLTLPSDDLLGLLKQVCQ